MKLKRLTKDISKKEKEGSWKYTIDHQYFREFFDNSTDIYFFRIVDQMAVINLET
jgi:hypothetical protein